MSDFNDKIIAEYRANAGRVDSAGFGTNLVLLHTRGAKTGTARVNPAMSLRDGDDWLVVASAMGAAKDPAWAVNLRAHPEVEIEVATDRGVDTVPVTAVELDGDEYDATFARFVRRSSAFATYQKRATERRLPVIRLSRRSTEAEQDAIGPDDPARTLVHARPDDEGLPHYGVVGDNYTVLIRGEDTDGRYALIDMLVPPGGGPPPHRHDFEEMFHVLEGEFEVTFRGEKSVIRAGETINVPARAPHFFRNASDGDARVLCTVSPPGLEEYFMLWGVPLPNRTTPPQLSEAETQSRLRRAIELGPRYAIENLGAD